MGAGVGLAAGGAAKGFGAGLEEGQSLQQGQASSTLGSAARLLSGAPPADQSSSGPLGALGNAFQSQMPSAQGGASQAPAQAPAATGIARSPSPQPSPQAAAPPPQAPLPQAPPQVQPGSPPRPPMPVPGLAPAQPGIANTGVQQGAPPATPPPQAQMQMSLPQPAPNIARQPAMAPPQPGQFDLPNLTKAILKANPRISDRQLGNALTQAIPLLNAQGLQQYRSAAEQIRRDQLDISGGRLTLEEWKARQKAGQDAAKPGRDLAAKRAAEILAVAGREYSAVTMDPNADPKAKAAAEIKYEEAKKQAQDILSKGYAPPAEDSSGESEGEGLPDEADAIAQAKEALQNKGVDKKAVLERLQQYYPGVTEQDLQ